MSFLLDRFKLIIERLIRCDILFPYDICYRSCGRFLALQLLLLLLLLLLLVTKSIKLSKLMRLFLKTLKIVIVRVRLRGANRTSLSGFLILIALFKALKVIRRLNIIRLSIRLLILLFSVAVLSL